MFELAIFFGCIQLDAEREIVHIVLLKYNVTLNAALNQWRNTHSLFQQCIVKEIKAFYVWGFFCGFVAFYCLLVLFLWLDWFGFGVSFGKGTMKRTYLCACPVLNGKWKMCSQSWKHLVIDNHYVTHFLF